MSTRHESSKSLLMSASISHACIWLLSLCFCAPYLAGLRGGGATIGGTWRLGPGADVVTPKQFFGFLTLTGERQLSFPTTVIRKFVQRDGNHPAVANCTVRAQRYGSTAVAPVDKSRWSLDTSSVSGWCRVASGTSVCQHNGVLLPVRHGHLPFRLAASSTTYRDLSTQPWDTHVQSRMEPERSPPHNGKVRSLVSKKTSAPSSPPSADLLFALWLVREW